MYDPPSSCPCQWLHLFFLTVFRASQNQHSKTHTSVTIIEVESWRFNFEDLKKNQYIEIYNILNNCLFIFQVRQQIYYNNSSRWWLVQDRVASCNERHNEIAINWVGSACQVRKVLKDCNQCKLNRSSEIDEKHPPEIRSCGMPNKAFWPCWVQQAVSLLFITKSNHQLIYI